MEMEAENMIKGGEPIVKRSNNRWVLVLSAIFFFAGLVCLIIGITNMKKLQSAEECQATTNELSSRARMLKVKCEWSKEAQRVGLPSFLKKVQTAYYANNPDNSPWQPGIDVERAEFLKDNFYPYNPHPEALKKKTDHALALLDEINKINIDQSKLKPRESKSLAQVKHFLKTNFGVPYDENYYAGDWMMGPNLFCWQPMCSMMYSINSFLFHVKPKNIADVNRIIKAIMDHKTIIVQYRENIKYGVKAGMVRSAVDCKAGADAFREKIIKLVLADNETAVLQEWYTAQALKPDYLNNLTESTNKEWEKTHGKSVNDSIKEALIQGLGKPLLEFYKYLRDEHKRYCLPAGLSSGLGGLPVDYVYLDGVPQTDQRTTKKLPTGEAVDGKKAYKLILPYFTTTDITPEKIYEEGQKQLNILYSQVVDVAKNYTKLTDKDAAIAKFKVELDDRSQWHNRDPFPEIESNQTAFERCVSPESAAKYCPKRWEAVQKWASYCQQAMSMIAPKTAKAFHFTGAKMTTPSCPIDMLPHYNPSKGAQFYQQSNKGCTRPSYFGLPFFLKDMGPIFQEWSVTAHESRPGHHTQVQGYVEHFQDPCAGIPQWLDGQTYYTVFTEGWGLYSENPVMSDDTDIYKDNLLQKYGMLKWQVWRAVRLIVDTGLHYRNMTRAEALKMFEEYAWDTSDFAVKEVTRYQSDPGQATAYMLGRLDLMEMRAKSQDALQTSFNLKDFHLQVLSQGTAPITFLQSHIDNWIKCVKTKGKDNPMCDDIVNPMVSQLPPEETSYPEEEPPRPRHEHYV